MKVVVLGAGVVGVTSAYYLAQAGHDVVVIDRQSAPGLETSFANAGQVSPGLSAPWAAPGVPAKALRGMLKQHSAFLMRPNLDPALWRWLRLMLANCNDAAYQRNKSRMVRLAEYSRDCLADLRDATGLRYDGQQRGLLQLFRTQEQLDHVRQDTEVLAASGVPYEVLDEAGCTAREPALARVPGKVAGGLLLPGDETGDAFKFTQALATLAEALGVEFRFDTDIRGLHREGDRITGVDTETGRVAADRFVVCLGSYSARLVRELGIELPVYPVKGYSLTIPISDPDGAPASTVLDETYKVAITRLGERIRVGGLAELAGFDRSLRAARRATLAFAVSDLYPDGGDPARGTFWTGLRPMTPDGTPVVGGTRYANLFLNTGHGTLGWTMSCGSGRLVADLVSERRPNIPHEDLALSRYAA